VLLLQKVFNEQHVERGLGIGSFGALLPERGLGDVARATAAGIARSMYRYGAARACCETRAVQRRRPHWRLTIYDGISYDALVLSSRRHNCASADG
jgi:hypothetical protein